MGYATSPVGHPWVTCPRPGRPGRPGSSGSSSAPAAAPRAWRLAFGSSWAATDEECMRRLLQDAGAWDWGEEREGPSERQMQPSS
jgi:hypothetical protein